MSFKKIFTALLVGMMVAFAVTLTVAADGVQSIVGYVSNDGIWGECGGAASESFVLEVYSDDTLMGTATLQNIDGIIDGDVYVTWHLKFVNDNDPYWTYDWEKGHPHLNYTPTTVKLICDGELAGEGPVKMNGPDNLWPVTWENIDSVAADVMIGSAKYATLQDAVDASNAGDVIVLYNDVELTENAYTSPVNSFKFSGYYGLMIPDDKDVTIDLNGNEISYEDTHGGCDSVAVYNLGNLTITDNSAKAKGKISYVAVADNVNYNQNHAVIFNVGTLTVNKGTIQHLDTGAGTVSDAIDNNSNISYNYDNDAVCTINGGTIIGGDYRAIRQYTHYNEGVLNRVTINGGVVKGGIYMQHGDSWYYSKPESGRLNVDCQLVINGGSIVPLDDGYGHIRGYLSNPDNNAFFMNITGGEIEVPVQFYVQRGARYSEDGTAASGSVIKAESNGARTEEFIQKNGGFISGGSFTDLGDEANAYSNLKGFLADGLTFIPGGVGYTPYLTEKLVEEIVLEFEEVTTDVARDEKLYNINLVADADTKTINRLNSVDLTFALTQKTGKTEYEIIASNDEIAINPVNNSEVRYEFHYKDKDADVTTDTMTKITIGQVKFTGYGVFSFKVATADTNAAHATMIYDNIVDTFVPGGVLEDGTEVGEFDVSDDTITDVEILVPTEALTINVNFPNAVENNEAAYQDMKVIVSGGDLETDLVIELGDNGEITPMAEFTAKTSDKKAVAASFEDGAYVVTITDLLTTNTAYTVTVSGAGYRTARYTVTMTMPKTLNFWNNVKDNDTEVEVNKDSSAKKVTYLAGDIVKDGTINIYDLSAVVSYFGEEMTTDEYNAYAKYDLNRDGKIDSKDVAYVLVSWAN